MHSYPTARVWYLDPDYTTAEYRGGYGIESDTEAARLPEHCISMPRSSHQGHEGYCIGFGITV